MKGTVQARAYCQPKSCCHELTVWFNCPRAQEFHYYSSRTLRKFLKQQYLNSLGNAMSFLADLQPKALNLIYQILLG